MREILVYDDTAIDLERWAEEYDMEVPELLDHILSSIDDVGEYL